MTTDKRSPDEILAALEEEEIEGEVDRVASMSSDEVERELVEEGIDVKELRAGTDSVLERAMRKRAARPTATPTTTATASTTATPTASATPSAIAEARSKGTTGNVVAMPRRTLRWALPLVAAAGFAVLVGTEGSAMVAWLSDKFEPKEVVTSPYPGNDSPAALRRDAARALAAGAWGESLALLDRAKGLDPRGDEATQVQEARKLAQRMLDEADAARTRPEGQESGP